MLCGFLVAGFITGCAGEGPPPSPLLKEGGLTVDPILVEGGLDVTATVAPTPSVVSASATPSATALPTATATFTATPTATREPRDTATPTSTATSSATPKATNSPEPTATLAPSPTVTATLTATPEPTDTPSPTPNPLDAIRFVDNDDCSDGISRDLLPTMDLMLEYGDASYLVVVEVADEPMERQQGLMCRETVPYGSGMLFVFESAFTLSFWMLNTYVSLDIVYLDDERRAIKGLRMEPCPRPDGADDTAWRSWCSAASSGYGSGDAALYALELPAGWLASIGLEVEKLEGVSVNW